MKKYAIPILIVLTILVSACSPSATAPVPTATVQATIQAAAPTLNPTVVALENKLATQQSVTENLLTNQATKPTATLTPTAKPLATAKPVTSSMVTFVPKKDEDKHGMYELVPDKYVPDVFQNADSIYRFWQAVTVNKSGSKNPTWTSVFADFMTDDEKADFKFYGAGQWEITLAKGKTMSFLFALDQYAKEDRQARADAAKASGDTVMTNAWSTAANLKDFEIACVNDWDKWCVPSDNQLTLRFSGRAEIMDANGKWVALSNAKFTQLPGFKADWTGAYKITLRSLDGTPIVFWQGGLRPAIQEPIVKVEELKR